MKTWVRKTLSVGVLAAGALLFAPGAANADVRQSTGDNNGILNGTQLVAPISVPVNIVGNSLGILGEANSFGAGVNRTEGGRASQSTGDNNGILNGTQAYLPISVPLNVVGNAVAVAGEANAAGVGVNGDGGHRGRKAESAHVTEGGWGGQSTGDNNGILNGTQIYAPIDIPINVCGNALALLGGAHAGAICANDVWGSPQFRPRHHHHGESAHVTEGARQSTGDNNGILNGTQLYAPISLPVNLAGNSLAVLGAANSRAIAVNRTEGGWGGQSTGDNNGILNGTQIAAPISLPINICGNALGVLGAADATAACGNGVDFFGDDNDRHHGHGHGHGHGNGNGDNAGDNGDNDGSYMGDNGAQGAGNGGYGNGGAQGAGNGGYGDAGDQGAGNGGYGNGGAQGADNGSDSGSHGGRGKSATEASPVSNLTDTVGGVSDTTGLGGLGLLSTLR